MNERNILNYETVLNHETILLEDYMLSTNMPNQLNIKLQRKNVQIVKGTVYTSLHEICEGAIIEVKQINAMDCSRTVLGYTITNEKGEYAITIEANCCAIYEFVVYMPFILSI